MRKPIYKVLWIDDRHEEFDDFKSLATLNGINLVAFKSIDSGMTELEKNYLSYDGVVLDAMGLMYDDDLEGTEDVQTIFRAKERLERLRHRKHFDIFVLTGEKEMYKNDMFKRVFTENVYGKDGDEDILFQDLRNSCASHQDAQLREQHYRAFRACEEGYVGVDAAEDLLTLLKIEDVQFYSGFSNTLRKIIEDVFRDMVRKGLLPPEFVERSVALTAASDFLFDGSPVYPRGRSKATAGYVNKVHNQIPLPIRCMIQNLVRSTNDDSHRGGYNEHIKGLKSPYLFHSLQYQLMELLVWYRVFVDGKPQTNMWDILRAGDGSDSSGRKISGKVIKYGSNLFAFLETETLDDNLYISKELVEKYGLKNGDVVEVFMRESVEGEVKHPTWVVTDVSR